MKKLIILLLVLVGGMSYTFANEGCNQHLSPEEFRAKQEAFITERAELTLAEAKKFFPIYFELQAKKKEINDNIWKELRKGKEDKLTDAQYEEIMLKVYDLRLASDKLDKSYYEKYKKVLSPKKIYQVQRAEARFHREILKGVQRKGDGSHRGKK